MKYRILALLFMTSCNVGPDYHPPQEAVASSWESEASTDEPLQEWWLSFHDALLTKYIEEAASHNEQLKAMEAHILEARGLKEIAASSLFPQLMSNWNATKTYFSKNGPVFAGSSLTQGPSGLTGLPFEIQTPQVQNLYNALLDASWEIDLFGKSRRAVEAAEAQIGVAEEKANDLRITLFAEVARNYFDLRATQKKLHLLEDRIALLEESLTIAKKQRVEGLVDQRSVLENESSLTLLKSEEPLLTAQIYQSIFALSVLTGKPPEALVSELVLAKELPALPGKVAVGLRSDLLRRRPDVREKERALARATAEVGVSVASFFPSLVLGADLGLQALELKKLFQPRSKTWDYGGNIGIPIFQGGNLVGHLHVSKALAEVAVHDYHEAVLEALSEAETALKRFNQDQRQVAQMKERAASKRGLYELSRDRFDRGIVGREEALMSERLWKEAEESLVGSEARALLDLVSLYKALGG